MAKAKEEQVVKVPSDIPYEYAATISVAPATAFRLLEDFVSLKAGDVIIQNDAASSVGQAVIQLAPLKGVKTINILKLGPSYEDIADYLKDLGADIVLDDEYVGTEAFKKLVSDLPSPALAIDNTGGPGAADLQKLAGAKASVVSFGRTPVAGSVKHFSLEKWLSQHSATEKTSMLSKLASYVKEGSLKLLIEKFPFNDWKYALEQSQKPYRNREVLLVMEEPKKGLSDQEVSSLIEEFESTFKKLRS